MIYYGKFLCICVKYFTYVSLHILELFIFHNLAIYLAIYLANFLGIFLAIQLHFQLSTIIYPFSIYPASYLSDQVSFKLSIQLFIYLAIYLSCFSFLLNIFLYPVMFSNNSFLHVTICTCFVREEPSTAACSSSSLHVVPATPTASLPYTRSRQAAAITQLLGKLIKFSQFLGETF